jgi:hypothetical protein
VEGIGVRDGEAEGDEEGVGVGVLTRGVTDAVGRGVEDEDLGVADAVGVGETATIRGVTETAVVTSGATVGVTVVPYFLAPVVSPRVTKAFGVTVGVTLSVTTVSPSEAGATEVPEPPVTK